MTLIHSLTKQVKVGENDPVVRKAHTGVRVELRPVELAWCMCRYLKANQCAGLFIGLVSLHIQI
jgi:hypothetical protein